MRHSSRSLQNLVECALALSNPDVLCCRRTSGSLLAGLSAGILGVTGWIGFLYFTGMHAVVSPSTIGF